MKLPPTGDLYPNLNVDSNGAPNTFNSGLGYTVSKPNRPKSTWTRSNRMDVGPLDIANSTIKSTMGKRGVGEKFWLRTVTERLKLLLTNAPRWMVKMASLLTYRWGWRTTLARSNENTELELPRA